MVFEATVQFAFRVFSGAGKAGFGFEQIGKKLLVFVSIALLPEPACARNRSSGDVRLLAVTPV